MKKTERGSTAVETALVFPIVLLLTIGMMEYGKYFFDMYRYQQAVYSGARVGAMAEEENKAETARAEAIRVLSSMGITGDAVPTINVNTGIATGVKEKTAIQVSIVKAYTPMIGFDRLIMPDSIRVYASQLNY